ncbi:unnamed protein product [Microthlaspi erraticum]|uniref:Protein kinase domain-containing protein n=1 Tax=Microthlaspi erraticum TaxID=1685480 RepID=A0A6D2L2U6_9BRAS|nr:unnamed protein product [Microthlaspi erraticum]
MDSLSSIGAQTTIFCMIFLFLIYPFPCVLSQKNSTRYCEAPFQCGNIRVAYPFSGENRPEFCGDPSLRLRCNKSSNTTSLFISDHTYTVLNIDTNTFTLRLARQDFSGPFCSASFSSAPLLPDLFHILKSYKSLTVYYMCDSRRQILGNFTCPTKGLGSVIQSSENRKLCDKRFSVTVPTSFFPEEQVLNLTHLETALRKGFEVKLKLDKIPCPKCLSPGANCGRPIFGGFGCCELLPGSELTGSDIHCRTTYASDSNSRSIVIATGSVAGSILTVYVLVLLAFYFNERRVTKAVRFQNLEALVTLRRYSYGEIKKITKSFTEVVGQGGFGTVYKGKLRDGRKVAVKVLKDFKSNGEDFINEVASMSQTSHVNIVSLLGFCYEGSKRAIVYEFLEYGSLDQSLNLDVSTLYGIALGVGRGLEYLHFGCKTRIVHFDIKPQNVLLDDNLRPKVSDFGLAKLCEKQESALSLFDRRGTIGYVAPELFSRMYGNVSHKSDVYSYGMLVLEMIGEKNKKRDANADPNNSSAYFPDWIYKDLENGDFASLLGDELTLEEQEIAKKMILVGLWCIQLRPLDRPSMNKVVEMMEGSLDSLEAPPKPLLHMPVETLSESSLLTGESSSYSEV